MLLQVCGQEIRCRTIRDRTVVREREFRTQENEMVKAGCPGRHDDAADVRKEPGVRKNW